VDLRPTLKAQCLCSSSLLFFFKVAKVCQSVKYQASKPERCLFADQDLSNGLSVMTLFLDLLRFLLRPISPSPMAIQ
jgi:hypothetical protein